MLKGAMFYLLMLLLFALFISVAVYLISKDPEEMPKEMSEEEQYEIFMAAQEAAVPAIKNYLEEKLK